MAYTFAAGRGHDASAARSSTPTYVEAVRATLLEGGNVADPRRRARARPGRALRARGRARRRRRLRRGHPRRLRGPRHRPGDRSRSSPPRSSGARDDPLERPDGRLRGPALLARAPRPSRARSPPRPAVSVVGGGDSVAALKALRARRTRSASSRPAAGPPSSSSKTATSRACARCARARWN